MSDQAERFAVVLYELGIPADLVEETAKIFRENGELAEVFKSPAVPLEKKHRILAKIFKEPEFSPLLLHFLEKACDDGCIIWMEDIYKCWIKVSQERKGIMEAELYCVTKPDEKQAGEMKSFLLKKYGKQELLLHIIHKPELMGGFLLKVGDVEYDFSLAGRLNRLRQAIVK